MSIDPIRWQRDVLVMRSYNNEERSHVEIESINKYSVIIIYIRISYRYEEGTVIQWSRVLIE